MLKKMMLLAMAVGALVAFGAPAAAQADVELTDEGQALPAGAEVTITSTNLTTTLAPGRFLKCNKVTFHFEVLTNGKEHIVLTTLNNTEGTTEGCTATIEGLGTFGATITDPTVDHEVTIDTWGTTNIGAAFTSDVPALGLSGCKLSGNVHADATTTTDILHVTPSKLTGGGGSEGCSKEGSIAGEFTLETEDGTPVEIHSVETP